MRENEIISAAAVAKEFELSESLAREIVSEETQRALRRSWAAWLFLVAGLSIAGYVVAVPTADKNSAVWILLAIFSAWILVGRYLAGPAIRAAAREKAARLRQLHS